MVIHVQEKPVRTLKFAAHLSLTVGSILLIIKFLAYFFTGSTAILSDAAESIVNVVAAAVALYSLRIVIKPADEHHPYGHGKIEFFSAAFEGGAIIAAAIWIIYKALSDLFLPSHLHQLNLGIWLLGISTVINLALGWFLVHTGKSKGSLILEADGKHILTDVATSVGVLIGLILVMFTGWGFLDSVMAILVAINIIFTGWKLFHRAAKGMMDESTDEDKAKIVAILDKYSEDKYCTYHKLRHRLSGGTHYVDFHLIFPATLTIDKAHTVATAIELEIVSILGDAGAMAHIEPCKNKGCPNCHSMTNQ